MLKPCRINIDGLANMYICICKNVTDGQIRKAVRDGRICNLRGLRRELGACDQCGKCAVQARQIIRDTLEEDTLTIGHGLLTAS